LARERQPQPRFDGVYANAEMQVRFTPDGTVQFADDVGTWVIDGGRPRIATASWQCEGALDHQAAYLLCSPEGRVAERARFELLFSPS
jgi:hypothetical protein